MGKLELPKDTSVRVAGGICLGAVVVLVLINRGFRGSVAG